MAATRSQAHLSSYARKAQPVTKLIGPSKSEKSTAAPTSQGALISLIIVSVVLQESVGITSRNRRLIQTCAGRFY